MAPDVQNNVQINITARTNNFNTQINRATQSIKKASTGIGVFGKGLNILKLYL